MAKKILFTVHDFYPQVGGSGEVVYRLARRFVRAGYDTSVATERVPARKFGQIDGIKISEFKIRGNKVKGYQADHAEQQRYINFVAQPAFDVIINYAAQSWSSDLIFENIEKVRAKKILIPCGYTLRDPRYLFYFRWLPKVLNQYDHLVYLSEHYQDIRFHYEHHISVLPTIIPNGADEEEFLKPARVNIRNKYTIHTRYIALCVANYFFLKGQDFILRAFNKLKYNEMTLVLIGQQKNDLYFWLLKFLARGDRNIFFLPAIDREETVAFFKEADLFLFGSRLECSPLVMFESFASKTLFITQPVGNTKEYSSYNVIVNSPSEMKEAVEGFMRGQDPYQKKIALAYNKYLKDHTYTVLFERYRRLVET